MSTYTMTAEEAARYDSGDARDPIMDELRALLVEYVEIRHPDGFVVLARP